MKKSILLIALLLGIMSSAKADDVNVITTATYGNAKGNMTRLMTLSINTPANYVAFQLDLTLPSGTTITDASKITAKAPMINTGKVTINGTEYTTTFQIDGQLQSDGTTYRIIAFNYGNTAMTGSTGDVCLTIPLTYTEGVTFDVNTITASNIIFVEGTNLTGVTGTEATSESRLWGDVVKDRVIDVSDYQTVANKIAGKTVSSTADMFAADMVNDDVIDVSDYQALGNTIAGK